MFTDVTFKMSESYLNKKFSDSGITDLEFNSSGDILACATADGTLHFLETKTLESISIYEEVGFTNKLCWIPDENKVLTATKDGSVNYFEANNEHSDVILSLDGVPEATYVASSPHVFMMSGHIDGSVGIIMKKGQGVYFIKCHKYPITGINIKRNEDLFITTSIDGILRVWNLLISSEIHARHQCFYSIQISNFPIASSRFLFDNETVACACLDGKIKNYNTENNELKQNVCEFSTNNYLSQIAYLPTAAPFNNRYVVYQNGKDSFIIGDCETCTTMATCKFSDVMGHCIACHPKDMLVASGGGPGDGRVVLYDVSSLIKKQPPPVQKTNSQNAQISSVPQNAQSRPVTQPRPQQVSQIQAQALLLQKQILSQKIAPKQPQQTLQQQQPQPQQQKLIVTQTFTSSKATNIQTTTVNPLSIHIAPLPIQPMNEEVQKTETKQQTKQTVVNIPRSPKVFHAMPVQTTTPVETPPTKPAAAKSVISTPKTVKMKIIYDDPPSTDTESSEELDEEERKELRKKQKKSKAKIAKKKKGDDADDES